MRSFLFLHCLSILLSAYSVSGEILRVPTDHDSIQSAIDAAADGDIIHIAAGTYNERINTQGKAITLRGTGGADATIIDGSGESRSAVVTCREEETAETRFIDLSFINGMGSFNQGRGEVMGGGALIREASPTFIRCVFRDNYVRYGSGGAVAITGGSPLFLKCRFQNNRADYIAGGMLIKRATPLVLLCSFTDNNAETGGGVYIWKESQPTFEFCDFRHNIAKLYGGAIYNWKTSSLLASCHFDDNQAQGGNGVFNHSGSVLITHGQFGDGQVVENVQIPILEEHPETATTAP